MNIEKGSWPKDSTDIFWNQVLKFTGPLPTLEAREAGWGYASGDFASVPTQTPVEVRANLPESKSAVAFQITILSTVPTSSC